MTTIVPTSEEDPVIAVLRFTSELAWKDAGPECMITSPWLDLVSLMITSAGLVISLVSDKDLECIFTVICNLVTMATSPNEALEMAKLISAKVMQQPSNRPALRMKILLNLYNLSENPYSKFFLYTKALNLAVSGKVTESIIPSFKRTETLLQEWKIGKMEQRDLFLTISNILKENKSMAKDSFTFLTKYLATYSGVPKEAMLEAKEAVRAIIEFVKSPDMFQSDLLDILLLGN